MSRLPLPSNLSLVIPLYNEAERFSQNFPLLKQYYRNNPGWELIFVNDGSLDETKEVIEKLIRPYPRMRLISYPRNQGKGYALKKGILAALKPLLLFSDIDFSTPLSELELFLPFMIKGAAIVIGTRKVKGASIEKHQGALREWLGKRFTQLTNYWLGMDVSDYTCGFKLFKTQVAKELFKRQRIKRWGFDAEILFLAKKFDHRVVEVPVIWRNDEKSRVSLVKDIFRSLRELFLICWCDALGRY